MSVTTPLSVAPTRPLDTIGAGPEWVPDEDILATYDRVVVDLLSVPLSGVSRVYSPQELDLFPEDQIRAILDKRGKFSDSTSREQLVQSVLNSQRVPIIFATPSNAWAFSEYTTGNQEESPDYAASHNVHYPVMSLQRFQPQMDKSRYSRALRRKLSWSPDGNAVMQGLQPVPVTMSYQLDVLTLTMRDANSIFLYLSRQYLDKVPQLVKVNHGDPWGYLPIYIFLDSVRDTSQLETSGERAEKILRTVYTFSVNGQIPTSVKAARTVRKIQYTITDETVESNPQDLEALPEVTLDPAGFNI